MVLLYYYIVWRYHITIISMYITWYYYVTWQVSSKQQDLIEESEGFPQHSRQPLKAANKESDNFSESDAVLSDDSLAEPVIKRRLVYLF